MRLSICFFGLIAAAAAALFAAPASAATVVMDFSPFTNLGFGVGVTQTLTQNGVRMQCLSGSYEITFLHELNLKDYTGHDAPRIVQFDMTSGLPFDFITLSQQDAFGTATITSNLGGSITFNLGDTLNFTCPQWKGVSWVRVTTSQQFGEWKFNSFTFDTVAHPATFACCNPATGACTVSANSCTAGLTPASCASTCTATACPIPNDACANATRIGNGTFNFSTVGATTDGPSESNVGFGFGDLLVNQDVWFLYTATCTGTVSVDLCGANYDSRVAIYSGACPTAPNTAIAGNDDAPTNCGAGSLHSYVTFPSTAGNQYVIRVGGFTTNSGAVVMIVGCGSQGACCHGATCTSVAGAAACTAGGTYLGNGVSCSPPVRGGSVNACCKADFNNSGVTNVQDIFDFLSAWFAGCP